MTTTKTFNLTELHARFELKGVRTLTNGKHEITLDNKHDISLIQLLSHNGSEYFSFTNHSTGLDESYWVIDDEVHHVTISSSDDETTEDTATEDTATEDTATEDTATEDTATEDTATEDTATDNLDISTIADLCSDFSGIELLELSQKIQAMAVKKIKSENKRNKVNKPEKTQTEKKVSAKNFNYFTLLCNWYNTALSAREIAADSELSSGYGAATIAEDMRVIKVLLGCDKLIQISKEWCDYIINYWSENSDTTWQRLHYAFAKEGRKCNDFDILCNYVINNGYTKEDIKDAIASQN